MGVMFHYHYLDSVSPCSQSASPRGPTSGFRRGLSFSGFSRRLASGEETIDGGVQRWGADDGRDEATSDATGVGNRTTDPRKVTNRNRPKPTILIRFSAPPPPDRHESHLGRDNVYIYIALYTSRRKTRLQQTTRTIVPLLLLISHVQYTSEVFGFHANLLN